MGTRHVQGYNAWLRCVTSTDKADPASVDQVAFSALKQSKLCDHPLSFSQHTRSKVEHTLKEEFQPQEVSVFLEPRGGA